MEKFKFTPSQLLRQKLSSMRWEDKAVVATSAISEMLYKTGNGFDELDNDSILEIIAGCLDVFEKQEENRNVPA